MNLDSLSFQLSQISNCVASLNKKNFKSVSEELEHFVSILGQVAERHLLRCLFSHVDFSGEAGKSGASRDSAQLQYLIQECSSIISKPNFVGNVCFAIDNPLHQQKSLKSSSVLLQLSRVLKFNKVQEIAFGLALLNSSRSETQAHAQQFLKNKLPAFVKNCVESSENGSVQPSLADIPPEVLHLIALNILNPGAEQFLSSSEDRNFLKALCKVFPRAQVPVILAPLLYGEQEDMNMEVNSDISQNSMARSLLENSLADTIMELGYTVTNSIEECHNTLVNIGLPEITPGAVAKVLALMIRTHTGLGDPVSLQNLQSPSSLWNDKDKSESSGQFQTSWNIENFIMALNEIQANLNWRDVVLQLDHPGFVVKDRHGLNLLIKALKLGLQNQSFPIELTYRHWKNVDGQLSLIHHILKGSDILCFADFPCRQVNVEILKSPPEAENKEIATWKSLDLMEALLYISDAGSYTQAQELFKFPIQHCPDVLVLGLLQISPPITRLRQDLLTNLIPVFLGNHPNSAIVLHHAWNCQQQPAVKPIIMHAMAEWYLRGDGDQQRLSRILDVAQDLKALSVLLNVQSYPFVIDLACLASRREYLKLDKWLSDKIREHREPFVSACIKFLQRRCPQILGGMANDEAMPKSMSIPSETVATVVSCLQAGLQAGSVSQELAEPILTMVSDHSVMLARSRLVSSTVPPVTKASTITRSSALDNIFPSSSLSSSILNASHQVDLTPGSLSTSIANLSLGNSTSTGSTSSSSVFSNLPSSLNAFSQSPASPARLYGSSPAPSTAIGFTPVTPQAQNALGGLSNPLSGISSGTSTSQLSSIIGRSQFSVPGTASTRTTTDLPNLFPDVVDKDIEDEANSYFQRIYHHPQPQMSVDEVLQMLKRFLDSNSKREKDVFNCMVKNLFEEYRFFPQYPEKELFTTAQLFGGIIEYGLVTYMLLGIALRYVLDALKKSFGSKMYHFGVTALDRFKTRLKEYPQYCQHLAAIPHFRQFPSGIITYVEYGARSEEPPNRSQGPTLTALTMTSQTTTNAGVIGQGSGNRGMTSSISSSTTTSIQTSAGRPSIANTTNIDTLLVATEKEDKVAVPPEQLQDRVAFIFNNLSQVNLQQKCDETKELIEEEHWPWIAQYLVMKRASIEPNFHLLYSNFLDTLKSPELNRMVIRETYRNIKVLLRSDKGIANFSDRSLLKNLGHWLGMLTLAKNKPILQVNLDPRALLIEAHHRGTQELLYVVPFVAKILESCAKSKVFKPPCPWTMAIMNVLAELHSEQDLKLNLKFEIEVLCKNLKLEISDLKPTTVLKELERIAKLEMQLSQGKPQGEGIPAPIAAPVHPPAPPAPVQPPVAPPVPVSSEVEQMTNLPMMPVSSPPVTSRGTSSTPTPQITTLAFQPKYSYHEINISSIGGLSQHIGVSGQMSLLQAHPQLKLLVRPAVERAVQECIGPMVERSVKIALTTAEQIVKKDFALDPEETRMRIAAHHIVRNLTAGMCMITCREQLLVSIIANLKNAFQTALQGATGQQKEVIEQASNLIAQENVELACAFIQKNAIEKAVIEIDKRLAPDFELRKLAKGEGRRFCEPYTLTYQAERMAEQIRLKVGNVTPQQMAVYEEFARNIPGFLPISDRDLLALIPKPVPSYVPDDISQLYGKVATELENCLSTMMNHAGSPLFMGLEQLLESVLIARQNRDAITGSALLQKGVEGLLEGMSHISPNDQEMFIRYRDGHLLVLKALQDPRGFGPQWTNRQVTKHWIDAREEVKWNIDVIDALIRATLLSMPQFDLHLAQSIESGMNYSAVTLAMQLIQVYLVDERNNSPLAEADLCNTIEVLMRIAPQSRQAPDGLPSLLDLLRTGGDSTFPERVPGGPTSHIFSGISQAQEFDDPPGLHEKTEMLLRDWINMYQNPNQGNDLTRGFTLFVHQLNVQGILRTDELITRFFRLLFLELNSPEPVFEGINFQVLTAFCHTLHLIRPAKAPGFTYAWLDMVGHRVFLTRLLVHTPQQKGWTMYAQLLVDIFKFLYPFLRNADLSKAMMALYRGVLRILLVLLHDFPEFLCQYHYGFCDVIPPNCIQMRNLILSAFPRNMRLPDPFTSNLKVDLLPEITHAPRIMTNFAAMIQPPNFKKDLDSYLKTRAPVTFLTELRTNLQVTTEAGLHYNVPLINALVLYVGTQAISFIHSKGLTPSMATITHSSHMDIFQNLAVDLDTEGRYLFLSAIANQLRYPNSHTHYFSCTLLYLFSEANSQALQEQITRVLLERLIVSRPHPWGLLITFIELIRNPAFKFWQHDFVRCAPEIEKLFESIARSCIMQKGAPPRDQDAEGLKS
ncbi:unnamed protein product [Darwinula stevensoni]|uniref:CCR4-NOT transcription complex subunit 1 n=1 Tax=Darwinula stevensoni TaxID=69355 RepID=A0A7R8X8P8_9CRUS|nr:unnamed protein product [Darwinula stevensoni]CAG0883626.1 unnamed protein product [Darwinula stevensoni]